MRLLGSIGNELPCSDHLAGGGIGLIEAVAVAEQLEVPREDLAYELDRLAGVVLAQLGVGAACVRGPRLQLEVRADLRKVAGQRWKVLQEKDRVADDPGAIQIDVLCPEMGVGVPWL